MKLIYCHLLLLGFILLMFSAIVVAYFVGFWFALPFEVLAFVLLFLSIKFRPSVCVESKKGATKNEMLSS
jgi:membrane protein implicated in regulation of membrane protease activity